MAPAASAATFSNNHGITINDSSENCSPPGPSTAPASATPYPSEIAVSGLGSSVSALNVSVSGLSHTLPDDIGLLLVSPAGQSTITVDDGHGATASSVAGKAKTGSKAARGPTSSAVGRART